MEQKRKDSVLTAEKGGGVISEDNSATSVAPSLNKRKDSYQEQELRIKS